MLYALLTKMKPFVVTRVHAQVHDIFLDETTLSYLAHCGCTALTGQWRGGNTATSSYEKDYTSLHSRTGLPEQAR